MGNKTVFLATLWNPNHYGPNYYECAGRILAQKLSYSVLNIVREEYPIQGWTSVLFLAESHIIFEGYPEEEIVELEIVTCLPAKEKDFVSALNAAFGIPYCGGVKILQKTEEGWK